MKSSCGSSTSSSCRTVSPPTPESKTAIGRSLGALAGVDTAAMIPDGPPANVCAVRALVVSNMAASRERPGRGVFVRDQVAALRQIDGVDVELFEFPPGALSYPRA